MKKIIQRHIDSVIKFSGEHFFKTVVVLALPIIIQNFMSASLNLIDNMMVGQLGDTAIASVGLANQIYFIVNLFLFGIGGGASMFISQLWSKKDIKNIRRIQGLSLTVVIAVCIIVITLAAVFPSVIMSILSDKHEIIVLGSSYLRIAAFSYIMFGISVVFSVTLRNTGHQRIPLFANLAGIAINTCLNYLLIFGNFGFPELGVMGAAIATVIARFIECSIIIITVYSHNWPASAALREMLDIRKKLVKNFFSQSGLLITKDVVWAIGITTYMAIYSRIGKSDIAAINILSPVIQLSTVFFSGIAMSCQIMVGNQLGVGDNNRAYSYAKKFIQMGFFGGIVVGLILYFIRNIIISPYNVSDQTIVYASGLISIFAMYMPLSMVNMISVVGIMRSGGDTMICLVMDLIAVYFIGMPIAVIGAFVFKLKIIYVLPMVYSQEIFKAIVMMKRFVSRKWMRNLTHGIE